MSNFLRENQYYPGDRATAERLNLDQDASASARGINCVGGFLKRFTGGMSITIPRYSRSVAAAASRQLQPFDILPGPSGSFYVQPGCINNVMASNMFDAFDYSVGDVQYLVANITLTSAQVTSVELVVTDTLEAPAANLMSPPTTASVALACVIDAGFVTSVTGTGGTGATGTVDITTQQVARLIGPGSVWLQTSIAYVAAVAAEPGLPPYNEYYTYIIK